jgi:hypothetical protein
MESRDENSFDVSSKCLPSNSDNKEIDRTQKKRNIKAQLKSMDQEDQEDQQSLSAKSDASKKTKAKRRKRKAEQYTAFYAFWVFLRHEAVIFLFQVS